MPTIDLKYGKTLVPFDFESERFRVLAPSPRRHVLSDLEINERLDDPIDSAALEEFIEPGESVLIVVPDATRQTACGQIVNLVIRRLIAAGTAAFDIRIIFATGIHRKVTDEERSAILTPFISQRIKTLDHSAGELTGLVRLGETPGGIPVELNRALVEHDHVILVGGISFHYFAGFTGGRKLICPGLASAKTIAATHKLAFDCDRLTRRYGVGTGLLDGNPVHEAFVSAVELAPPRFAISSVVDDDGSAVGLYCGDWKTSHRAACDAYAAEHTIEIAEKRGLVIASCGGSPFDINLIQAHKTLETASQACEDGGTIVLLAECRDGLGRDDFVNWFSGGDSHSIAARLCEKYQVNGQTAWNLRAKTERFDVHILSSLPEADTRMMGLKPASTLSGAIRKAARAVDGFIIPSGAKITIRAA